MSPPGSRSPGRRRGRGRPRGGDPGRTREQVLAAAADLFAEHGYRGTTMSAVADASGLSQTGLLHHYPSREALVAAVLERRDHDDHETLSLVGGDGTHGWGFFDRLIRLVVHNTGREQYVRLFTALAGEAIDADHPGHDWLRQHHARFEDMIVRALGEAVDDGTASPDVPAERVARLTTAVLDGLQVQWLMDPERVDMAGDVTAYVSALHARWGIEPSRPSEAGPPF